MYVQFIRNCKHDLAVKKETHWLLACYPSFLRYSENGSTALGFAQKGDADRQRLRRAPRNKEVNVSVGVVTILRNLLRTFAHPDCFEPPEDDSSRLIDVPKDRRGRPKRLGVGDNSQGGACSMCVMLISLRRPRHMDIKKKNSAFAGRF